MMPKVILSIIVPSYNTAKFMDYTLPTFIDSRLEGKLEVLIISDGSTDETAEYARKFAQDNSIIKVVEKENGGHGSVINMGIEIACGKYIKVVDGDDTVITENLVKLIDELEQTDADMVITQYNTIDVSKGDLKTIQGVKDLTERKIMQFDEWIDSIGAGCIHSCQFLRESVKGKFVLTEKCFYDDFEYTTFPVPYIKTFMYLGYPVVNYYIGQKEQSVNVRNTFKNREMHEKILMDSIDYAQSNSKNITEKKSDYINRELTRLAISNYNIYIKNSDIPESYSQLKKFDEMLRNKSQVIHQLACNKLYIRLVSKSKLFFNMIGAANRILN